MADLDNFDFGKLGAQALDMANADTGVQAPVVAQPVAPASPSVSDANVVSPPAPAQTPATPVQPVNEPVFEVQLGNGKVEKFTQSQLAQRIAEADADRLRQADYTRKTQELARQRQEQENVIAQAIKQQNELNQYRQFLSNPQVQQLLQRQQQPTAVVQQPQFDPSQAMTMGQGQSLATAVSNEIAQIRQQMQNPSITPQQIQQVAQEIVEDRMQVANYGTSISQTLNEIWQEHPILAVTPENEDILRYKVAQMQPASLEEAQQAFKTIATEMATKITATFREKQQQQVATKAQLASGGIEPPGGAAPQPAPTSFKDAKGGLDWKLLSQAAMGIANGQ